MRISVHMLYSSLASNFFWISALYVVGLFGFFLTYTRRQFAQYWFRCTLFFIIYCSISLALADLLIVRQIHFNDLNQTLVLSFFCFATLFVGVVVAIMKHHRLSMALQEADRARKVKSEFLANMSHEIRTPLNGIIGVAELMDPTSMNEEELEKLNILKTSSKALLSLLNDVLDFSALEADKVRLEKVPFDLIDHIQSVMGMFTFAAQEKGIFLKFDSQVAGACTVFGDPTRVRQILMNLLGNAVKFTSSGGVTLKLECMVLDGNAARYIVSVEDTGIGIHFEDQKRLFRSFSQADTSTTRKYGGTGLGLAICKSLVELMDGEIGVRSVPTEGSTFYFSFISQLA